MVDRHCRRQGQSAIDLLLAGTLHQLVEKAADLTYVARRLRQTFFPCVEFLEHGHWNVNVVFLEAENGGRIVHQYIRVQHEDTALLLALTGLRHRGRCRPPGPGHSAFTAAKTAAA